MIKEHDQGNFKKKEFGIKFQKVFGTAESLRLEIQPQSRKNKKLEIV